MADHLSVTVVWTEAADTSCRSVTRRFCLICSSLLIIEFNLDRFLATDRVLEWWTCHRISTWCSCNKLSTCLIHRHPIEAPVRCHSIHPRWRALCLCARNPINSSSAHSRRRSSAITARRSWSVSVARVSSVKFADSLVTFRVRTRSHHFVRYLPIRRNDRWGSILLAESERPTRVTSKSLNRVVSRKDGSANSSSSAISNFSSTTLRLNAMPSRPCPFPRCWTCSFTFSNGWQVEDYFLKILSALLTLFLFLCYKWNSTRLQCSSCREYAPTGCALFKFFLGCVFF